MINHIDKNLLFKHSYLEKLQPSTAPPFGCAWCDCGNRQFSTAKKRACCCVRECLRLAHPIYTYIYISKLRRNIMPSPSHNDCSDVQPCNCLLPKLSTFCLLTEWNKLYGTFMCYEIQGHYSIWQLPAATSSRLVYHINVDH